MLKRIFKSIINRFIRAPEEKIIDKNMAQYVKILLSVKSIVEADNGKNK